jgi:hypothetical protein
MVSLRHIFTSSIFECVFTSLKTYCPALSISIQHGCSSEGDKTDITDNTDMTDYELQLLELRLNRVVHREGPIACIYHMFVGIIARKS